MPDCRKWIWLAFFVITPLSFTQDSTPTVNILEAEAAEHRIGTRGPIYGNIGQDIAAGFDLVIGTDGKVVSVQTANGFIADLTLLCETWEYKPFERNGRRVVAKLRESLAILPTRDRSEVHVAFPAIRDWNSLRILLKRTGCYGTCPTYEIEVHGDGTVLYDGSAYVGTIGKKKGNIPHASLVELVDVFRGADYFSLADGYVSSVTDSPTYVSSISFDGRSKSVLDYVGREIRMPPGVSDVEDAIDRLSGASKWIARK